MQISPARLDCMVLSSACAWRACARLCQRLPTWPVAIHKGGMKSRSRVLLHHGMNHAVSRRVGMRCTTSCSSPIWAVRSYMQLSAASIIAVVALAQGPSIARACSCPSGPSGALLWPEDGATDVPVDTPLVVVLTNHTDGEPDVEVSLRTAAPHPRARPCSSYRAMPLAAAGTTGRSGPKTLLPPRYLNLKPVISRSGLSCSAPTSASTSRSSASMEDRCTKTIAATRTAASCLAGPVPAAAETHRSPAWTLSAFQPTAATTRR